MNSYILALKNRDHERIDVAHNHFRDCLHCLAEPAKVTCDMRCQGYLSEGCCEQCSEIWVIQKPIGPAKAILHDNVCDERTISLIHGHHTSSAFVLVEKSIAQFVDTFLDPWSDSADLSLGKVWVQCSSSTAMKIGLNR